MSEKSKPKKLCGLITFSALILILGCSDKMSDIKSVWLKSDINIDGSLGDWDEIAVVSADDNDVFSFKICNDDNYLYTAFYSRNLRLAGQIKMMGVKLWIDSTGGKDKKRGLFFRGGPELSNMRDSTLPEKLFEGKEIDFFGEKRPIEREKFAVINNEGDADFILKDGSNGPAIQYGISNGTLIYELKIPLRVKSVESFAIGANPGEEVSLCLELQGGERPKGMMRGERPEGFGGGRDITNEQIGGGMPRGEGGMRGGMPPEGGKSSEKKMWIKIHLASAPEASE